MIRITHEQYKTDILAVAEQVKRSGKKYDGVFGIPRGGQYPASMVAQELGLKMVYNPAEVTPSVMVVDDLVDSGKTMGDFREKFGCDFAAIYIKDGIPAMPDYFGSKMPREWLVFPDEHENDIEDNFRRFLEFVGEDPTREGLVETPRRMRKAYEEVFSGYRMDPKSLVKTFTQGTCREMVILRNAEYVSFCEHHMFPFFGHCSIGYIPNDKVIGVSKLARLLDCYAKRMQIQERLTSQIADFLEKELNARGVYVVCEGVHFCMKGRGVKKQDSSMITSAIRGEFMENAAMRAEFLSLIGMK